MGLSKSGRMKNYNTDLVIFAKGCVGVDIELTGHFGVSTADKGNGCRECLN